MPTTIKQQTEQHVEVATPADVADLRAELLAAIAGVTQPPPPEPQPFPITRAEFDSLVARVEALEQGQVEPSPSYLTPSDFNYIGGYVVPQDFARPGLAIDFANERIYSGCHAHSSGLNVWNLPQLGTGQDQFSSWPTLQRTEVLAPFWDSVPTSVSTDPNGLQIRGGKLWVSPRGWYTSMPSSTLKVFGLDVISRQVEIKTIPVATQAYGGGFIKGHPTQWLIGSGGYMSGQGGVAGPTLATIDGEVLISQVDFGLLDFDARTKRPPTVWPKSGVDNWMAMLPRDGVGAWAADAVVAGGIWTPRGICFWARLQNGEAEYIDAATRYSQPAETWLYVYDPVTFELVHYHLWPHGNVTGHEIGPDGTIYLMHQDAYRAGEFVDFSVIKAFQLA